MLPRLDADACGHGLFRFLDTVSMAVTVCREESLAQLSSLWKKGARLTPNRVLDIQRSSNTTVSDSSPVLVQASIVPCEDTIPIASAVLHDMYNDSMDSIPTAASEPVIFASMATAAIPERQANSQSELERLRLRVFELEIENICLEQQRGQGGGSHNRI